MVESSIKNVSSAIGTVGSEESNDKPRGRRQHEVVGDEGRDERVVKTPRIKEGGRSLFVKPVVVEADHNDSEQEHTFSAISSGSEYNMATSESNIDSALLATGVDHHNNTDDIIRDIPEVSAKEVDSGMISSGTVVAAAVAEAEMNYKEFLKRVESTGDDHTSVNDMGAPLLNTDSAIHHDHHPYDQNSDSPNTSPDDISVKEGEDQQPSIEVESRVKPIKNETGEDSGSISESPRPGENITNIGTDMNAKVKEATTDSTSDKKSEAAEQVMSDNSASLVSDDKNRHDRRRDINKGDVEKGNEEQLRLQVQDRIQELRESEPQGSQTSSEPDTSNSQSGTARRGRKLTQGQNPEEYEQQRKDSHKEVERRRRESINTAIKTLSDLLPVKEISKAAILSRAAEYILKMKETESANIEKWTLQKILNEQKTSHLTSVNENLQRELNHCHKRMEYLEQLLKEHGVSYQTDDQN